MSDTTRWDAVADLLIYPDEQSTPTLEAACAALATEASPLANAAGAFLDFVENTPPTDREELFTRTFDINPACCLEIGWQLFGQEYARGTFLVDMRQTMRAVGVEETSELPDHLIHALRVLGRLVPFKATVFSTTYIQPALEKMLDGFTDDANPWHRILVALSGALETQYGDTCKPENVSTPTRPTPYEIPAEGCTSEDCTPETCATDPTGSEVT